MSTPRHVYTTDTSYGRGEVRNFATILDHNTREQALMTARHPNVRALALMPDAHLGRGATVGSVLLTEGGVLPAAVGVDIGCGVIACSTPFPASIMDTPIRHAVSRSMRDYIASGVGQHSQGFAGKAESWRVFTGQNPFTQTLAESQHLRDLAYSQFGSLGSGNHFAEFSEDAVTGRIWLVLHSGSRGVGNKIATEHIRAALTHNKEQRFPLEHEDLAVLFEGTEGFRRYREDLDWLQKYAAAQRAVMMAQMQDILFTELHEKPQTLFTINCHHNYTVAFGNGLWLTRKGAIDASHSKRGVIPGSMGADTLVVDGTADETALWSAPHGAGRLLARGAAKRTLDIDEFRATMESRGVTWQDRSAQALLDEAPLAYKPMAVIERDAVEGGLIEPETIIRLRPFINYKGV